MRIEMRMKRGDLYTDETEDENENEHYDENAAEKRSKMGTETEVKMRNGRLKGRWQKCRRKQG